VNSFQIGRPSRCRIPSKQLRACVQSLRAVAAIPRLHLCTDSLGSGCITPFYEKVENVKADVAAVLV